MAALGVEQADLFQSSSPSRRRCVQRGAGRVDVGIRVSILIPFEKEMRPDSADVRRRPLAVSILIPFEKEMRRS